MDISTVAQDIIRESRQWSLAGDCSILQWMQEISKKLELRVNTTNDSFGSLDINVDRTSTALSNANHSLTALQYSQFVESRTYEESETLSSTARVAVEYTESPEKQKIVADKLNTFLKKNLDMLRNCHERYCLDFDGSDNEDHVSDYVYQPKNPYNDRPLPHIYGSQLWKDNWHIGLCDSNDDYLADDVSEQLSELSTNDSFDSKAANLSEWKSSAWLLDGQNTENTDLSSSTSNMDRNSFTNEEILKPKFSRITKQQLAAQKSPFSENTISSSKRSLSASSISSSIKQATVYNECADSQSKSMSSGISGEGNEKGDENFNADLSDVNMNNVLTESTDRKDETNVRTKTINLFDDDEFNTFMKQIVKKATKQSTESDQISVVDKRFTSYYGNIEDDSDAKLKIQPSVNDVLNKKLKIKTEPIEIMKKPKFSDLFESPSNSPTEKSTINYLFGAKTKEKPETKKHQEHSNKDYFNSPVKLFQSPKNSLQNDLFDSSASKYEQIGSSTFEKKSEKMKNFIEISKSDSNENVPAIRSINLFENPADNDLFGNFAPIKNVKASASVREENAKPSNDTDFFVKSFEQYKETAKLTKISAKSLFDDDDDDDDFLGVFGKKSSTEVSKPIFKFDDIIKDKADDILEKDNKSEQQQSDIQIEEKANEDKENKPKVSKPIVKFDDILKDKTDDIVEKDNKSEQRQSYIKIAEKANEDKKKKPIFVEDSVSQIEKSHLKQATPVNFPKYSNIILDEPPADDEFLQTLDNNRYEISKLVDGSNSHDIYETVEDEEPSYTNANYSGLRLFMDVPPDDDFPSPETKRIHSIFYDDFNETREAKQTFKNLGTSIGISSNYFLSDDPPSDLENENSHSSFETKLIDKPLQSTSEPIISQFQGPEMNINAQKLLTSETNDSIFRPKNFNEPIEDKRLSNSSCVDYFKEENELNDDKNFDNVSFRILPSLCKNRISISAKRRPSTRKARRENYLKAAESERKLDQGQGDAITDLARIIPNTLSLGQTISSLKKTTSQISSNDISPFSDDKLIWEQIKSRSRNDVSLFSDSDNEIFQSNKGKSTDKTTNSSLSISSKANENSRQFKPDWKADTLNIISNEFSLFSEGNANSEHLKITSEGSPVKHERFDSKDLFKEKGTSTEEKSKWLLENSSDIFLSDNSNSDNDDFSSIFSKSKSTKSKITKGVPNKTYEKSLFTDSENEGDLFLFSNKSKVPITKASSTKQFMSKTRDLSSQTNIKDNPLADLLSSDKPL